jgi:maleate cis-trans isomerase
MSVTFDNILDRLEMPLPEPKVVRMVDKVIGVHESRLRLSNNYMQNTLKMASYSTPSISKADSKLVK